ncbi:MAG TPA: DinB family protein [Ktedonobacteraceae bacterium]
MTSNPVEMVKMVLSTAPARWLSLTETLSPSLLARTPAPDEWSALECLYHLLDTENIFPVRIRAILAGQPIVSFDPDTEGTKNTDQTPEQLAQKFASLRQANLEELEYVTIQDLSRTAEHSELGTVTLGDLLHEWAAHDLMHTVQAERALMQPFIVSSGPWRSNFTDHDVSL